MATLSQNITQAISDFAAIKTAIEAQGVTVASGTPTSDYDTLIGDIETDNSEAIDALKKEMIERNYTSIVVPEGTRNIDSYMFYYHSFLTSITIPDSVRSFGSNCLRNTGISSIYIPKNCALIAYCFSSCSSLTTVYISNNNAGTYFLQTDTNVFLNCPNLEFVTFENGYNRNGLNLSVSTKYSAATILSWLNAFLDRTGETAYTLTMGATNLAKLTAEEIAIATNKNWNLA